MTQISIWSRRASWNKAMVRKAPSRILEILTKWVQASAG